METRPTTDTWSGALKILARTAFAPGIAWGAWVGYSYDVGYHTFGMLAWAFYVVVATVLFALIGSHALWVAEAKETRPRG